MEKTKKADLVPSLIFKSKFQVLFFCKMHCKHSQEITNKWQQKKCSALLLPQFPNVVQPWLYYILCSPGPTTLILSLHLKTWQAHKFNQGAKKVGSLKSPQISFSACFSSLVVNTCDQEIVSTLESGSPCHWK